MNSNTNTKPFEYIQADGYQVLKLFHPLMAESAASFEEVSTAHFKDLNSHLIVQCDGVESLPPQWVKALLKLQRDFKAKSKSLRLIGVCNAFKSFLRASGLDSALLISGDIKKALEEIGLSSSSKQIDVDFINPFLEATINVLKIQCATEVKPGTLFKKSHSDPLFGDVSGVIGLVNDRFSGSVVISFPKTTFLRLISKMLREEVTELNKDSADGAGELTNIIFGQAKAHLNVKGYGVKMAIPSVILGSDHIVQQITMGPRMAVPFESDSGPFQIEICTT